jgi:hypothetical protein
MDILADLMVSVNRQMENQTSILKSILDFQINEAAEAKRRYELDRAQRDTVSPPSPTNENGNQGEGRPEETGSATLGGFLAGLMALFGPSSLSAFGLLAAGATALTVSLGAIIGAMRGQITAISTFLKILGKFTPGIVKSFSDFKTAIVSGFKFILNDFKVKIAFVKVITNEVFTKFTKFITDMLPSSQNSKIVTVFSSIKKSLDILIEPFKIALKTISELAGPSGSPSKITGILKSIGSWFGGIAKMLGSISSVVGKLFAPIAIIMTLFDTIKGIMEGYTEGGILGALEGGITGFFNSLIFGPLDLVKNLVSWVSGKLGFKNFSGMLDSFSFADLFSNMISSIFDGVKGAFSIITDLFTFSEEDKTFLGAMGKLTDIIYAPINMAINFVKDMFGFEKTDEPFKLQDFITEKINSMINFIVGLIPSGESIKKFIYDSLPGPLKRLFDGAANNYSDNMGSFSEDYSFAEGTRGFQDFGSGTPSVLHGLEAVIPRNTEAGSFLAGNFDNNWNAKIAKISTNSAPQPVPIIINAPNNSTTQVNQTGGSASSVINSFGGNSRNDLDYMSRPAGVN